MSFEDAIRQFLESFKLPGEAQKIIRILEAWSRQFYAQEPGIFSSADAVYILAISVIMLNTDKHNPAVLASPLAPSSQKPQWCPADREKTDEPAAVPVRSEEPLEAS